MSCPGNKNKPTWFLPRFVEETPEKANFWDLAGRDKISGILVEFLELFG